MVATGFVQRIKGKVGFRFGAIFQNGAPSAAPFLFPGPAVNGAGGTLANIAPFGSLLTDTTNGTLYQNWSATLSAPQWMAVTPIPVPPYGWSGGTDPSNTLLWTPAQNCQLTGVWVDLATAEGAAASLTVVKATGATPISGGSAVAAAVDCNAAPAEYMPLLFAGTTLAAGDRLGIVTSGRWTTSSGGVVLSVGVL